MSSDWRPHSSDVVRPKKALHGALISRIKIMAQLDIAEKRLPQDGRITLRVGGRPVDVRVSTLPTGHGERAVLRLLEKDAARVASAEQQEHLASRQQEAASRNSSRCPTCAKPPRS